MERKVPSLPSISTLPVGSPRTAAVEPSMMLPPPEPAVGQRQLQLSTIGARNETPNSVTIAVRPVVTPQKSMVTISPAPPLWFRTPGNRPSQVIDNCDTAGITLRGGGTITRGQEHGGLQSTVVSVKTPQGETQEVAIKELLSQQIVIGRKDLAAPLPPGVTVQGEQQQQRNQPVLGIYNSLKSQIETGCRVQIGSTDIMSLPNPQLTTQTTIVKPQALGVTPLLSPAAGQISNTVLVPVITPQPTPAQTATTTNASTPKVYRSARPKQRAAETINKTFAPTAALVAAIPKVEHCDGSEVFVSGGGAQTVSPNSIASVIQTHIFPFGTTIKVKSLTAADKLPPASSAPQVRSASTATLVAGSVPLPSDSSLNTQQAQDRPVQPPMSTVSTTPAKTGNPTIVLTQEPTSNTLVNKLMVTKGATTAAAISPAVPPLYVPANVDSSLLKGPLAPLPPSEATGDIKGFQRIPIILQQSPQRSNFGVPFPPVPKLTPFNRKATVPTNVAPPEKRFLRETEMSSNSGATTSASINGTMIVERTVGIVEANSVSTNTQGDCVQQHTTEEKDVDGNAQHSTEEKDVDGNAPAEEVNDEAMRDPLSADVVKDENEMRQPFFEMLDSLFVTETTGKPSSTNLPFDGEKRVADALVTATVSLDEEPRTSGNPKGSRLLKRAFSVQHQTDLQQTSTTASCTGPRPAMNRRLSEYPKEQQVIISMKEKWNKSFIINDDIKQRDVIEPVDGMQDDRTANDVGDDNLATPPEACPIQPDLSLRCLETIDQSDASEEKRALRKKGRHTKKSDENRAPGIKRTVSTSSESTTTTGVLFTGRRNFPVAEKKTQEANTMKRARTSSATVGKVSRGKLGRFMKPASPSESSFSVQDDKEFREDVDTTTVSDHLRWYDGIGYLAHSTLHFEFNHFGLVVPMAPADYERHCITDVYRSLQQPLSERSRTAPPASGAPRASEYNYRCTQCRARGNAVDFVTPTFCSIACVEMTKNKVLLKYIKDSTHAYSTRGGVAEHGSCKIPDGGGDGAMTHQDKKAQATPATVVNTSTTSDEDSMSSLSSNSNVFQKRPKGNQRSLLPSPPSTPSTADSSSSISSHSNSGKSIGPCVKQTAEFNWEKYLTEVKGGEAAPVQLFVGQRAPLPDDITASTTRIVNPFVQGMKLEAIDPENNSLFCVCSVKTVRGYRMKLHFDGYTEDYDFWVNADSVDIFPPDWCRTTERPLQPPYGIKSASFHWKDYLRSTKGIVPKKEWFRHLTEKPIKNQFAVGMSLEADDLRKSGKVCVATVTDIINNRILVHFDGWDERYDYWVNITSPYIHPVCWHRENNEKITPPPDFCRQFEWGRYLRLKGSQAKVNLPASRHLFKTRKPIGFKVGHRLEVVDRAQERLIRPATVIAIDGFEIKVCFDGWPITYAFWIEDDSPNIHPVNWCSWTNHPLEPPPNYNVQQRVTPNGASSCSIGFCQGKGNSKFPRKLVHDSSLECPYRMSNWTNEGRKKLRINNDEVQKFIHKGVSVKPEIQSSTGGTRSESNKFKPININTTFKRVSSSRPSPMVGDVEDAVPDEQKIAEQPVKRIKIEPKEDENEFSSAEPIITPSSTTLSLAHTNRGPMESKRSLLKKNAASAMVCSTETPVTSRLSSSVQRQHQQQQASEAKPNKYDPLQIALPVIDGYGPRLLQAYEIWKKHSRFLDQCTDHNGESQKNPLHWTVDETARYIEKLPGCTECAMKMRLQEINGKSFLSFTQNDLMQYMGFKVGPAIKIYNRIIHLRQLVTSKFVQL
ncbi:uncharacterized protein LOC131215772 [Anopheles bellator]|uniref:uncharacterized protein LOC131215772 n=1 Tax=Anopheles bellator TaxID=139047 RepID=UPI0026496460|nr:uncharacterized protein LOC131215772 [Anopheles bellator]